MAKRKTKPKTIKSPSIETLAGELSVRLDCALYDTEQLERRAKNRSTDPCAAEQATYDAAVSVMQQLFDATVIAAQISMIAQMELMACRMNNP